MTKTEFTEEQAKADLDELVSKMQQDEGVVPMETPWHQLDGAAGENAQIIEDVMALCQRSERLGYHGTWLLYVPPAYKFKLDEDYRGPSSSDIRTVRERIVALPSVLDALVSNFIVGGQVLLELVGCRHRLVQDGRNRIVALLQPAPAPPSGVDAA